MIRAAALLLLLAGAAQAVPPDARLAISGKKSRIEKIPDEFTAVEVEPAGIIHAELLPTHELLLEPRAAGLARVFLFAPRLVRVIEVAVDVPLPRAESSSPPAACATPDGAARVSSPACYQFWRERLAAAESPGVSFEDAGLMAMLRAAQAELDKAGLKLRVAVSPFGIRLLDAKDDAERRRGLRAIWPAVLGPLRVDQ